MVGAVRGMGPRGQNLNVLSVKESKELNLKKNIIMVISNVIMNQKKTGPDKDLNAKSITGIKATINRIRMKRRRPEMNLSMRRIFSGNIMPIIGK
ncbi:hypothetical protein LCM10_04115 [Rossellomorea aquimaris]|uniref:hypothetical protein n=1 Tax=Rossellomorea aquimaris TaxID=189382 RepID=UPI001CD4D95E|nr:hypothetical protein [Rossellomorea aquimaris]MCA1054161.1 hypothetical protein [Rossellomorea aquimaris]